MSVTRRAATLVVASLLAVGLAVGGTVLDVPYVALAPGPVTDTLGTVGSRPLIEISGRRTYPTSGELDLTTVSVSGGPPHPLDLGTALRGWLDHTVAVVPQEVVYPPNEDPAQVDRQNVQDMEDSQQHATTAALRALGVPVRTVVVVRSVSKASPAAQVLRAGDVLVSADGTAVSSTDVLRTLISRHRAGTAVRLVIRRAGNTIPVAVVTVTDRQQHRPVIGIEPGVMHVYPFHVRIGLKDVGGPSAGLMFALGIIDKLTPGPLTGGRHIAGTGEIDDNGNVGEIGGIQQKIVAARRDGATVFLTPAGNCADAVKARPAGLRLIKVTKLSDALASLHNLSDGIDPLPSC